MNKLTRHLFAILLSASIFPVSAVIVDDATPTGDKEHQQLKEQEMNKEKAPTKKEHSKKERMHQKKPLPKSGEENASSMNNKPIGTTSGVTHNGSTDDTKMNEPINGTTTGTNNESNKK